MTTKNNAVYKPISSEHLVQLVALTHNVLQTNENLLCRFKADEDLYTVYENELPIVSYGGIWTPVKKCWPEIIRIYPQLGQQIHRDLNYEIRLSESSQYGHTQPNFFSLTYCPDQGVAYGAIPDSECNKIRLEIFDISDKHTTGR